MTTITLPPDLATRLADEARRRGITPEQPALDSLRQLLPPPPPATGADGQGTLFDFIKGYIGAVAGSSEPLSEDCGRRFADGCAQRHGK